MSFPPERNHRPNLMDDALLSGLSRLKATEPSPSVTTSAPTAQESRPRVHRTRSAPLLLNVPYAYFPHSSSPRYIDRSLYIPRADWLEVVERATGLGKSSDGDVAATEKLLRWIRAGALDPTELFRAIVAGSALADTRLNARVLAVVSRLCIVGGPDVLPAAVYLTNVRKPSPALRICLDVLKSLGYTNAPEDVLYDDNKVREMRVPGVGETGLESIPDVRAGRRLSKRDAILAAAVEACAISTGRKLIFHHRYPEVEGNYSLDRYFRKMHIENHVDPGREKPNMERHSLLISRVTLAEVALITHSAVVAADRLERAQASPDITVLALSEACNVYSFAEYVRLKIATPMVSDFDLDAERACLAGMVVDLQRKGGSGLRLLKRFVEPKVLATITDTRVRASRPESKHRREVLCTFTSFEAMHRALAPPGKSHSGAEIGD